MSQQSLVSGTRAIITGASSGIGKALAADLAKKFQARLVLNARNKETLRQTAQTVQSLGGQCEIVVGDVSSKDIATKLAARCIEKFGGIDLLVNNAGLSKGGPVMNLTPEDWEFVFGVNFFGALYTSYAVLPHMLAAGKGKIVNVASVAGKVALPGTVCYAASKFAMVAMSKGMAAEFVSKDIDVITVCPGWVRTEFFDNNNMLKSANPTKISQQKNLRGWIMRNLLSISSEQAASAIINACQQGGPQEIVLTIPGVILERFAALAPRLAFSLISHIDPRRGTVD
jgi:3-oxoacyl-[acyl-carrier protein] reductase